MGFCKLAAAAALILMSLQGVLAEESTGSSNSSAHELLSKLAMGDYDKRTTPENEAVEFLLILVYFHPVPELDRLDFVGRLNYVWVDSRLEWDNNSGEDYEEEDIKVPTAEIWKPEIVLQNSFEPNRNHECTSAHALVDQSGEVVWSAPCNLRVHCDMTNLRNNPNGQQSCSLKFGRRTTPPPGDFVIGHTYDNFAEFETNSRWDVSPDWQVTGSNSTVISKRYACCSEQFLEITFSFQFKKKDEDEEEGGEQGQDLNLNESPSEHEHDRVEPEVGRPEVVVVTEMAATSSGVYLYLGTTNFVVIGSQILFTFACVVVRF